MTPSIRRWMIGVALAVGALVLSGCNQGGSAVTGLTLKTTEHATTRFVDEAIASIDPASIDHIDVLTNESSNCRGTDVDPDGRVRQWENLRDVWLKKGVNKLDLLDQLVTAHVHAGWRISYDEMAEAEGGRRVQLLAAGKGHTYGLSLVTGAELDGQNEIGIGSASPCFEVDGGS